jgi:hypothetical protein
VTENRSTSLTCPPVLTTIVITWPLAAWKVTWSDHEVA